MSSRSTSVVQRPGDRGEGDFDRAARFGPPGDTAFVRYQIGVEGVGFRLVTCFADRLAGVMSIEHPISVSLSTDPRQLPFVFAAAFNTGSAAAVDQVYQPDAIFVREDGVAVTGADRRAANGELLALGLPIDLTPRRVDVVGDIALLIVDWVVDGPGVHLEGSATDVARLGADGYWRYVIDNPFGTGGN